MQFQISRDFLVKLAGSTPYLYFKVDPYLSSHSNVPFVGYSGVSSFGFGGANARADVFAIASRGPRKPKKVGWNHGRRVGWQSLPCDIGGAIMVARDDIFS